MFELKVADLKKYEEIVSQYEQQPIEKGMILFYGSSGFTRWAPKYHHRPLEEDIRMKNGAPGG